MSFWRVSSRFFRISSRRLVSFSGCSGSVVSLSLLLLSRREDSSFRTDASFSSMEAMAISMRPSGGTTSDVVVGVFFVFFVVNLVSKLGFFFVGDGLGSSPPPSVRRTALPTAFTMRPNFPTFGFGSSLLSLLLFLLDNCGGLFLLFFVVFLLFLLSLSSSLLLLFLFLLLSSSPPPSSLLPPPNHGLFVRAR